MRTAAVWLILLLSTLGLPAATATHKAKPKRNLDLADTVDNTLILSKFASLVQASGLGTFLSSRGPFTLFVPTNSAFSKLPPGMYDDLLRPENKDQLQRIILFHLVNGATLDVKDLQKQKSLPSCEGNPIPLRTSRSGTQFVGKARLLHGDQKCANGTLNEIDTLLIPPQLVLVAAPATPPAADTNAAPADTNVTPAIPETATNAAVTPAAPPSQ